MDKLKQCAMNFESLFDIEYKIIIARKGKETCLTIDFYKEEFVHLMGLHKLEDVSQLKGDKGKIFDNIMNDNIKYDDISKSVFFDKNIEEGIPVSVKKRIDAFLNFLEILDTKNLFFKYNQNIQRGSKIRAEYLLETLYDMQTIYIFIDKRDLEGSKVCKSFFPKDKIDYASRQANMTLLYKEKLNKSLNEHEIQFVHSGIKNKKIIAVKNLRIKKRVTLEARYFDIVVSARKEETAKVNLAKELAQHYSQYLNAEPIGEKMYSLIKSYEEILNTDYNKILDKIIII